MSPRSSAATRPCGAFATIEATRRPVTRTSVHAAAGRGDCGCTHLQWPDRGRADSGERRNTNVVLEVVMRERRRTRRTPAGGVQAEKQQRYVRLIAEGRFLIQETNGTLH